MGGGGGKSPKIEAIAETPKAQTVKNQTEAVTKARDDQREKAKKLAGIAGSVKTTGTFDTNSSGKNTLG